MKRPLILLALIGFISGQVRAEDKPAGSSAFKTDRDKVSYALGMNIGNNWKRNDIDVDPDLVLKGVKDALSGNTNNVAMTEQEAQTALMNYQQELMGKQEK